MVRLGLNRGRAPAHRTLLLMLLGALPICGQTSDWEEYIDPEAGEEQAEAVIEFLRWRQLQPLDINRATMADWLQFPWMDNRSAAAIVARRQRGPLHSVAELQELPELSRENYRRLLPYIQCTIRTRSKRRLRLEGRHRLGISRPFPPDTSAGPFAGDGSRLYQRLQLLLDRTIHAGIVLEKDPGESATADLCRAHALWLMPWLSGRLCLGAFKLQSGRGLIFQRGTPLGGGMEPVAIMSPQGTSLRPSASTTENGHQQGVALSLQHDRTGLILFSSRPRWDATFAGGQVTALQWSGLHRTAAERGKRAGIQARTQGAILRQQVGSALQIGLEWGASRFSAPFAADSAAEKRHDFQGERNWNSGIEAELRLGAITLMGEWAGSRSGGMAREGGLLLRHHRLEAIFLQHRYDAHYHPLQGISADEPRNHRGWYLAWQMAFSERQRLAASLERQTTLAPAWRQPMPFVQRTWAAVMLTWSPGAAISCWHRLRGQWWSLTESAYDQYGNPVKQWRERHSAAVQSQLEVRQPRWNWRMRFEFRRFGLAEAGKLLALLPDSTGWLIYQQLRVEPGGGIRLTGRYTFVDAASYETRFYLYENDSPGALTLAQLAGRRCRAFLLLQGSPCRETEISLRWSWLSPEPLSGQRSGMTAATQALSLQLDWRLQFAR